MTSEPAHLTVETERLDDVMVVSVAGDVDAATAPDLAAAVDLGDPPASVVDLRLAEVSFIDSSGLRALLELRERVVAAGGTVVLGSTCTLVDRLLEVTGLSSTFASA